MEEQDNVEDLSAMEEPDNIEDLSAMEEQDDIEDLSATSDDDEHPPPIVSEPMDASSEKMINPSIIRYSEYLMHQMAYQRSLGLAYVDKYISETGGLIEGTYVKRVSNQLLSMGMAFTD